MVTGNGEVDALLQATEHTCPTAPNPAAPPMQSPGGAIARLQRASTPSVSSEHLPASAAAALVQPWHASLTTDLIIAEAATAQRLASPDGPEVLVVGGIDALRALLDALSLIHI